MVTSSSEAPGTELNMFELAMSFKGSSGSAWIVLPSAADVPGPAVTIAATESGFRERVGLQFSYLHAGNLKSDRIDTFQN